METNRRSGNQTADRPGATSMRWPCKHLEPQIAHLVLGNTSGGKLSAYLLKHLVDNGKLKEPA